MRCNSSKSFSAKKSRVKILLYLILQMRQVDRPGWHSLHTMWPEEENFSQIDFLVPHYGLSWGWCPYAVKKSLFIAYIKAKNINFNLKIFVTLLDRDCISQPIVRNRMYCLCMNIRAWNGIDIIQIEIRLFGPDWAKCWPIADFLI